MTCANCLHAKTWIGKTAARLEHHYVKCNKGHWFGKRPLYSIKLRKPIDCADYESMGDDEKEFLKDLPHTRAEYIIQYNRIARNGLRLV